MDSKFAITHLKGVVTKCNLPVQVRNGWIVNAVLSHTYIAKDGTEKTQNWKVTYFSKSYESARSFSNYRNKRLSVACHVNGWLRELPDGNCDYVNNLNIQQVKEVSHV
jgi:hypothetical protein